MTLAAELKAILACPKCKGTVESLADDTFLACRVCRIKYPVIEGIPLMMIEEAVTLDEA
jgi:uncharacterized protein YbaR (Trm112 family)